MLNPNYRGLRNPNREDTEYLFGYVLQKGMKEAQETSKLNNNFTSCFSHRKHSGGGSKYHPYNNKGLSTVSSVT